VPPHNHIVLTQVVEEPHYDVQLGLSSQMAKDKSCDLLRPVIKSNIWAKWTNDPNQSARNLVSRREQTICTNVK